MTALRSSCSWAAGFACFVLLASRPSIAGSSGAPASPDAVPARHWAGNLPVRPVPARSERGARPSALSDLPSTMAGDPIHGTWSLLAGSGVPSQGPARVTHGAIHDPVRHRVVVFGGGGGAYFDDTWVLESSGSTWNPLVTQGSPPSPRRLHTAIYDAENDRMVVYGGYDGTFLDDVWALSFGSDPPAWTELTPGGSIPAARAGHAAIYDAPGRRMIVFAGYDGVSAPASRRKDVWSLSLHADPAWAEITPAADGPSARSSLEAVFDSQRRRMVVFGGTDPAFRDDAWALSLDGVPAWSAVEPKGQGPAAREEHSAIYDPAGDRVVFFGGYDQDYYYGDTWALEFSGGPHWTKFAPTGLGPGPRWGHTAVYDGAAARMVVFGGYAACGVSSDTYFLALSGPPAWTNPTVPPGPGPMRHTFASAYDSERHRYVLFGGSNYSSNLNDTWAIELGEHPLWSALPTQGGPPGPRRLAEAIYDPRGDRLIVFGGVHGAILGDLWQLSFATDPPTWSPLVATGGPPAARAGHAMIYDPLRKRMIVFGGWDGVSPDYRRNDVWALDLRHDPEWIQLSPDGPSPSPRSSHTAIYDPRGNRMIVFGGTTPTFLNQTWALALNDHESWEQLAPAGALPSPREEHSAMYDPVRERMVIVGGYENASFYGTDDTWSLSLGDDSGWSLLSPSGPRPPVRWGHAAVYDPTFDRMVMHGGVGPGLDQTWALTWGQPALPSPTLLDAQAEPDLVRLTWSVPGNTLNAAIYRAEEGGPWTLAGEAPVNPAGETVFEDHQVTSGLRYGYRAGVIAGGTENLSGDTWVDVPSATGVGSGLPTLAILGVRSSSAELSVRISLASGAPAHMALFDVSGRSRASRDLGAAGPGSLEVSLGDGDRFPAGVYWLKLSQAGRAVTAKTVVLK